ncbi:MAG: ABC transporter permease [Candidatus Marinimicrobia bacterium]|nr:ABC transporter permease [Candidatus Neomarinimicrobiota bacterium]MCF7829472.1 ABC transporter permease [Candidatus Neomarinimicrobiota bacterium]MCF7880130.1 ABC transporter permease [Candidatus Neomarinimicrobiota bacterium]
MPQKKTSRRARLLPLIKKEFIQIFRTKPMLAFIFVMPIVQTLVMGYAVTTEVTRVPMVICDQERSQQSRQLIRSIRQTEYFDLVGITSEYTEIERYMDSGEAASALVIPPDFTRQMRKNKVPVLQAIMDGSNSNTAQIAIGYLQGLMGKYGEQLRVWYPNDIMYYAGLNPPIRIAANMRVWYNPNFENTYFMVPGIIGLILAFSTLILTAVSIVREREVGTLEQLMVSPLKSWQIMLGKITPFALLGFVEISIVMVAGKYYFMIPMRGSFPLLFFVSFLMLLTTLGLGLFVSSITKTQQQSMFVAWFFLIFIILMSGFFFPVDNMPLWLRRLSLLDPLRYYIACLRGIFLKGAGFQALLPQIGALAGYGVLIITFASLRFQKRIS